MSSKDAVSPWWNSVLADLPTFFRMWRWIVCSWAIVGFVGVLIGASL